MATYLYLRISSDKQSLDAQEHELCKRYPEGKVYYETISGAKTKPVLRDLTAKLQKGDTLAVAALDRLGRRMLQVVAMIEDLSARGVNIISMRENIDYSNPTGKLMVQMLCSFAEMERNVLIQRTKAALDAIKAKGVKLGAQRTYSDEDVGKAKAMRDAGYTYQQIRAELGMSVGWLSAKFGKARL